MILRAIALVIAVAGLADPALTVSRRVRQPLTITIVDTASLSLPDRGATRRERAYQSASRLVSELSKDYAVTVREQSVHSTADPCPSGAACVVVSDGARPRTIAARSGLLGGVKIGTALTPNVAITAIDAPREADLTALAAIDVHLEAQGVSGTRTKVEVLDGDVVVGSSSHSWPAVTDRGTSIATLGVEWVPLASGHRDLRVVATADPDEATSSDNEAHALVDVVARRFNVLVYEPQLSWVSAFVRRALEADERFNVLMRARLGPGRTVSSTALPLDAEAMEEADVAVVVVAAPHLLARGEVDALERLVRLRGASVVLLLDAPPAGDVARLANTTGAARREAAPVALGGLKAAELIVLRPRHRAAAVLAAAGHDPVIVSIPLGQGRIILSGAVDAWRFRADGAFDAFWRALVADAARVAGGSLVMTLSRATVSVGEPVDIDVEWRSVGEARRPLDARAVLQCAGASMPIRLWPSSRRGRFRGTFEAPQSGPCAVKVDVRPLATAEAPLRVLETRAAPFRQRDELSAFVRAHGGPVVAAGDEGALVAELHKVASPQRTSISERPMRSPWWIVPVAACLGGEWWLRRRRSLS